MKKYILIILLFFSTPCYPDEITGLIDHCLIDESRVVVEILGSSYQSNHALMNDSLLYAFRFNQEITLNYHAQGNDNIIDFIMPIQSGGYYSKIASVFIGAVSAGAFALGLGVKIS